MINLDEYWKRLNLHIPEGLTPTPTSLETQEAESTLVGKYTKELQNGHRTKERNWKRDQRKRLTVRREFMNEKNKTRMLEPGRQHNSLLSGSLGKETGERE